MSAFLVVDTKINNPEIYEDYKKLAKPIAEKFGGVYLARGGELEICESNLWSPTRIVIVQFPSMQDAQAFINSEEYAPIKKIRQDNAECTLFIVDGG